MHTFSLLQTKFTDGFWAERQRIHAESTIKNVPLGEADMKVCFPEQ